MYKPNSYIKQDGYFTVVSKQIAVPCMSAALGVYIIYIYNVYINI